MSHDRWKDWLEVLGMVAIIGSLVFVGLQMQQDQSIAIADTYGNVFVDKSEWQVSVEEKLKYLTEKSIAIPDNKSYVFWN